MELDKERKKAKYIKDVDFILNTIFVDEINLFATDFCENADDDGLISNRIVHKTISFVLISNIKIFLEIDVEIVILSNEYKIWKNSNHVYHENERFGKQE